MLLRSDDRARRRREPERGVLHRVLLAHLATFVARTREHGSGRGLPSFVERELCRYVQSVSSPSASLACTAPAAPYRDLIVPGPRESATASDTSAACARHRRIAFDV